MRWDQPLRRGAVGSWAPPAPGVGRKDRPRAFQVFVELLARSQQVTTVDMTNALTPGAAAVLRIADSPKLIKSDLVGKFCQILEGSFSAVSIHFRK